VTALNPCVLASIPLAIGFVGGYATGRSKGYALLLALFLFLGIAATFTALGTVASLAGTLFGTTSRLGPVLIVVVCLVMGGQLLNLACPAAGGCGVSEQETERSVSGRIRVPAFVISAARMDRRHNAAGQPSEE
jgi:cytochrome c biogenesis protein CcdA